MTETILKSRQEVSGLKMSQMEKLMEYATVDNPKYLQAEKFSKWGPPRNIPKKLMYYVRHDSVVEVPRGINIDRAVGVDCKVKDGGMETCKVKYPEFLLDLRREQEDAKEAYLNSYASDKFPKSVVHLPTGKGKTILALNIASTLGVRTLVLVHKVDLLVGWQKDIGIVFGGKVKPGIIRGKSRNVGELITIATVQTLNNYTDAEFSKLAGQFGLIVQDEVHHCAATTFNIVDSFPARYRLGLSATPHREDGLDCCLEFFYGGLCYEYEYRKEDEDVCSVIVHARTSRFQYAPIAYKDGKKTEFANLYGFKSASELPKGYKLIEQIDYKERPRIPSTTVDAMMMEHLAFRRQVLNDAFSAYTKGHCILLLFKQKKYLEMFYDSFAEVVTEEPCIKFYSDSVEDDAEIIEMIESGRKQVTFATLQKVSEGTNVKRWDTLFLVSSIAGKKDVEQSVGRIRRKAEGKINPVHVYDYMAKGYSIGRHFYSRYETYRKLKCEVVFDRRPLLV